MSIIDSLKWRSATKKFDPNKVVNEVDIEKLIQASNLAATSFGLQPFTLVLVRNEELRKEIQTASYDQAQVTEASHLFILAVQTELGGRHVDDYMNRMAEIRSVQLDSLFGYKEMISNLLQSRDESTNRDWSARQAYIALGTMMSVAAELRIDACPMEGFDPIKVQEILDLKPKGLMPVVMLSVGYRVADEVYSKAPKVRKTREDFVYEVD